MLIFVIFSSLFYFLLTIQGGTKRLPLPRRGLYTSPDQDSNRGPPEYEKFTPPNHILTFIRLRKCQFVLFST
jgi:hypothetical protein